VSFGAAAFSAPESAHRSGQRHHPDLLLNVLRRHFVFAAPILALCMSVTWVDIAMSSDSIGGWQTRVILTARPQSPVPGDQSHSLKGIASYYWQGRKTASGEPFDKGELTAAHRTLPFNSLVRVTDSRTGNSVVVRINDRGPFIAGRVIDLSEKAAEVIGMTGRGLTPVELEVLSEAVR
jgi:rare lipoprotein A